MNKIVLAAAAISLSGCQLGDKMPITLPVDAQLHNGSVCVQVRPIEDEKLGSIIIYQDDDPQHARTEIFAPRRTVERDKCMPDLNYRFVPGKAYTFDVHLVSPEKERAHSRSAVRTFSANFRLIESSEGLQVENLP